MIGIHRNTRYTWASMFCCVHARCVEICSLGRYTTVYGKIIKQRTYGFSFWTLWFGSWICLACALVILISFGHFGANWFERYWRNK